MKTSLTSEQFEALRRVDTCTVANAIDVFEVRLRNEGFADATIRCQFPRLTPMLGHAATVKIKCSSPPPDRRTYLDRTDWLNYILTIPAPRVVVIQDVDSRPGTGSLLGEVHAAVLTALGCVGAVTNGSVRDLPAVEAARFHFFAGSVAVSHAYAHIVEIGGDVMVGGLKIHEGDLIHGDRHGILTVPEEVAGKIPEAAARIMEQERRLIAVCRSPGFSLEKLRQAVNEKP
jgi:4-hydroxy-4-methyl-2-oxoglutarate aldolase